MFATASRWTVPDALIFIDDGINCTRVSKRRPAYMKMMGLLKPRPAFQVLIVSERKSIGREMTQTAEAIRELAAARVEVSNTCTGGVSRRRTIGEKLIASVEGFADEDHIRKTSERTKEAHERIVGQGRVVGGRVFGYRNEHVYSGFDAHGNPLRSHTIRVVNEPEAAVVRRIFELYDSGLGLKAIAKKLTRDGALAPKPFQRRTPTPTCTAHGRITSGHHRRSAASSAVRSIEASSFGTRRRSVMRPR